MSGACECVLARWCPPEEDAPRWPPLDEPWPPDEPCADEEAYPPCPCEDMLPFLLVYAPSATPTAVAARSGLCIECWFESASSEYTEVALIGRMGGEIGGSGGEPEGPTPTP